MQPSPSAERRNPEGIRRHEDAFGPAPKGTAMRGEGPEPLRSARRKRVEATVTYTVELSNARAWTDEQMGALFAEGFPAFITADREVKKYIARVRETFPHLDVMLVDADG